MTDTDFDIFPVDCTPLRPRLQALDPGQASRARAEMEALRYPKLAEMDWPQLNRVGRALGTLEREGEAGLATMAQKVAVAERLTQVGERVAEMSRVVFANYGIERYDGSDITAGEAATMLYVLDHPPAAWFAELGDRASTRVDDKGFEARAAEADADAEVEAKVESTKKGIADAPVTEDPNQQAPADYHAEVPGTKIDDIKAWVEAPRNDFDLSEAERIEEVALRSHQAEIAEIRRRGFKQRKSVFTAMRKYRDTNNWVPPYLRGTPASEAAPAMPGSVELSRLTEGQHIHIVIGHDGRVRYWVEMGSVGGGDDE